MAQSVGRTVPNVQLDWYAYGTQTWWHGSVGRAHRSHRWGKREKCQPGGLSAKGGSDSSLLARKGERNPFQGFRATIERTDVGSSPAVNKLPTGLSKSFLRTLQKGYFHN